MSANRQKTREDPGYAPDDAWARIQLKEVIDALNGPKIKASKSGKREKVFRSVRLPFSEMELELRRLVTAWDNSKRNLRVLFKADPDLEEQTKYGQTILYTTPSGGSYLEWTPVAGREAESPQQEALYYFMHLITNPLWSELGGPCARCGKYFLKKTERPRMYCSRKCGAAITATDAVRMFRQREHVRKLERARKSIERWCTRNRRMTCKDWVAADTHLTRHWLTRAENNGALKFLDGN